jgi:hypothetical protein
VWVLYHKSGFYTYIHPPGRVDGIDGIYGIYGLYGLYGIYGIKDTYVVCLYGNVCYS